MRSLTLLTLCSVFLFPAPLFAYTTHRTTAGPLSMYFGTPDRLSKQETLTQLDEPLELTAKLENKGDTPLSIKLSFKTIETFELLGAEPKTIELPAKGTADVSLKVAARAGTYSAHYPVRLDAEFPLNGETVSAHIIQVVKTEILGSGTSPKNPLFGQTIAAPKQLPLNVLPQRGGLALATLDTYRVVWYHDGKPMQMLPVGFQGSEPTGMANIVRVQMDRCGVTRHSLGMHPPYHGGIGNVALEYRVKLPQANVISLSFFSAMRSVDPPEPPTDGVTFRVKVDGETLYEKHDDKTGWTAHDVKLSRFAGKEILLTLESDPGPQRSPTCDSCFWGDVLLFAGEPAAVLTAEEKQKLFAENLQAVKTGKSESPKTQVFALDGGLTGAVTFGENGLFDGAIGVGNAEKQVQFDGLRVWVKGQPIGVSPLAIGYQVDKTDNGGTRILWSPTFDIAGHKGTLYFGLEQNGPALQFVLEAFSAVPSDYVHTQKGRFPADDLISRIEFGPATHHAARVYYGHGYCIVEPEAFTANAGGHDLSTSHVGMDFENGLSVLQATSFPPDKFVVEPQSKRYTLSVHPGTTMTLLPGTAGALDCAIRFRPIHKGKPAPGVASKAGRFVFDIWGGKYKDHTEIIKFAAKYGLTDSLFLVHAWQRYGYDVRLPDIYPPNPALGTVEDMQETLKLCDSLGIQYGVHDNYTDFYPDADGYDFDKTAFYENGLPQLGWNNYGIEAQAYQVRPDRVQQFLERNLDLIVPNLPMSTYFVDVLTSLPPIDFYDRHGNFHSRVETQQCWSKAYDTIRERLSAVNKKFPSATTISEAGMDSLIGHLDGADCQFMFLSPEPGEFRTLLKCKAWSRVPWFDAVHHTKFSQHGVGYSSRYEAQRGYLLHNVESDDYITSEMLTGHALMVELASARRSAVRKYWLAQDLIKHLADKEIVSVEFVDGNIQRQKITWSDKTTVFVNLEEKSDWTLDLTVQGPTFVLPHYGYLAIFPNGYSAIHKQNGRIIESSRIESSRSQGTISGYFNARQKGIEGLLPVTPSLNSFQYLGENRFTATFKWNMLGPVSQDLSVFVHCAERRRNWFDKPNEAVLGGGFPAVPTSQWSGEMITDTHSPKNAEGQPVMEIPDNLPAGRYYLVVGLHDQKGNGQRAKLIGFNAGNDRHVVGWLNVQRKDGKVSNITLEPFEWDEAELYERLLPPKEPVEFHAFCKTKGGFKMEFDAAKQTALLVPLPDEPATEIALTFPDVIKSLKAIDETGKELRNVPFTFDENETYPLVFTTQPGEYGYQIVWQHRNENRAQ
jgi:hypothetical protein